MQDDELTINLPLLRSIFRRRAFAWAIGGLAAFAAFLALALVCVPQSFTSSVSIAMQQQAGSASPLAMLTGGGGQGRRYIGILKSRQMAAQVNHRLATDPQDPINLQQMYHLRKPADAILLLTKSVKPEDNAADGLLYVSVTMAGPARFAPHAAERRDLVKQATVQAADAYADALRRYYVLNDNERDSVLLRGADDQLRQARADYEAALRRALAFSRGLRRVDPRAAPAPGSDSGAGAASEISRLYEGLAQVQADIRAAQAAQSAQDEANRRLLQNPNRLSSEDPLLNQARDRVGRDQSELTRLNGLYGPDNLQIIDARNRLQIDQAALDRQIAGERQHLSTPNVRNDAQLKALLARQAVLQGQVARAERRLGIRRVLTGESGRLQTEVMLRLEALKETMVDAAKVKIENASSQSRTTIIDTAIPPPSGTPGLLILAIGSAFLVGLGLLMALVREYLKQSRATPLGPAIPAEGNGVRPARYKDEITVDKEERPTTKTGL